MKMLVAMYTVLAACAVTPAPAPTPPPTSAPARAESVAALPASAAAIPELAARRAQMIDWIREYREAGQYPTDARGQPLSVFMDRRGIRCPMAELIFRSGRADLVRAVLAENNTVRLADVTEGPLFDWMASSGLTQEEIALVQGAMEWDMSWQIRPDTNIDETTILARGQVRGRLETAERALRDGTKHSLEVAASRLQNGKLPALVKVAPGMKVLSKPLPVALPAAATDRGYRITQN